MHRRGYRRQHPSRLTSQPLRTRHQEPSSDPERRASRALCRSAPVVFLEPDAVSPCRPFLPPSVQSHKDLAADIWTVAKQYRCYLEIPSPTGDLPAFFEPSCKFHCTHASPPQRVMLLNQHCTYSLQIPYVIKG